MQQIEVTDLDKGFDKSGNPVEGMIYEKEYQFALRRPEGQSVRWTFRYSNSALIYYDHAYAEGASVAFKVRDANRCGTMLEVVAYSNGVILGKLTVWVHYRFRFFKRPILEKELEERRKDPWKIDQRNTALCGIACIFYLLATDQPDLYEQGIGELHRTGYALFDSYEIRPPAGLYEMDPDNSEDYPKGMPYADWISLAAVRSMESHWGYRGRKKEVFSAINWPPMLTRLGRTLLQYKKVEFKLYFPVKTFFRDLLFPYKKIDILNDIQRAHLEGKRIVLMIDMDMLFNRSNYNIRSLVRYHWIVYEGALRMVDRNGLTTTDSRETAMIYFQSYTWGLPPKRSPTCLGISRNSFLRNFYGYIEMAPRLDYKRKVGPQATRPSDA